MIPRTADIRRGSIIPCWRVMATTHHVRGTHVEISAYSRARAVAQFPAIKQTFDRTRAVTFERVRRSQCIYRIRFLFSFDANTHTHRFYVVIIIIHICRRPGKFTPHKMNALVLFAAMVVVLAAIAVNDVSADCWDTGCQLNSWAVKGCEQYGRRTTKKRPCSNGFIYTCCTKVQDRTEGKLPPHPECDGETKCLSKVEPKIDGCEPIFSGDVRKATETEPCKEGQVYSCCETRDDLWNQIV